MKESSLTVTCRWASPAELTDSDRALVEAARSAAAEAYAPYSRFRVGAAVRLADGTVVTGSNQENASSPCGTCAERTAAFYAHAAYPTIPFVAVAIAAIASDGLPPVSPVTPCGGCRQALVEYERLAGHPVRVLLAGRDVVQLLPSVQSLLPWSFTEY